MLDLGNGVYRFMLDGSFRPGAVDVDFQREHVERRRRRAGLAGNAEPRRSPRPSRSPAPRPTSSARSRRSGDQPETVVTLAGAGVGADVLNGLGYLEVTFRPSSGNAIDRATINGGELELRDAAGNLVPLTGTPIRVGTTDIYRYTFTGPLAAGTYTVTFVAGTFADSAGIPNQAKTESFRVEVADRDDPRPGPAAGPRPRRRSSRRGWIDVTFSAINGLPVSADSILDSGAELTLTSGSQTIVVDGTPVFVSRDDTLRRSRTATSSRATRAAR